MHHLWTERKATQEVFKDVVTSCRKKIKEVKDPLELNMAASVKINEKKFINELIIKAGTRRTSALYWIQWGIQKLKMRNVLRYITPSLPQFSTIKQGGLSRGILLS